MKTARKRRRRDAPDRELASALKVTTRTIRGWKTRLAGEPADIRADLRLVRQGKQWRFDLPKEGREFAAFLQRLKEWASKFTRVPLPPTPAAALPSHDRPDYRQQRAMNRLTRDFMRKIGLDGVDRSREVEISRDAMARKRCAPTNPTEAEGDGPESLSHEDWKEAVEYYTGMAAYVASKYQCAVQDFPACWPRFLRDWNEDIRNGKLDEWVGGPELIDLRQPAPVSLQRKRPQTMTEAEIQVESERLSQVWPEAQHWEKAETSHREDWEFRTLCEAAVELVQDGKRVTAKNLAPLLFYDWNTQAHWQNHQHHLKLARQGIDVLCVEELCNLGKRGVSPSEFGQRYSRADIEKAKGVALKRDASDLNRGSKPSNFETALEPGDLKGMSLLDQHGRPIAQSVE